MPALPRLASLATEIARRGNKLRQATAEIPEMKKAGIEVF
jgi:hypothetical protein